MVKNEQKGWDKQKIVAYNTFKIEVQHTVDCPLRAAPRAVISGE
jgi:hypothetical protein